MGKINDWAREWLPVFGVIVLAIVGVAAVAYILHQPTYEQKNPWDSRYCVEWEQGIKTDSLLMNCYDFDVGQFRCIWAINSSEPSLSIFSNPNDFSQFEKYNCMRYVELHEVAEEDG